MNWYFAVSVLLLAGLLFVPVSRLVFTLSVRRLEKRSGEKLGAAELEGQRRRARVIALVLVFLFSLLFNLRLPVPPHG